MYFSFCPANTSVLRRTKTGVAPSRTSVHSLSVSHIQPTFLNITHPDLIPKKGAQCFLNHHKIYRPKTGGKIHSVPRVHTGKVLPVIAVRMCVPPFWYLAFFVAVVQQTLEAQLLAQTDPFSFWLNFCVRDVDSLNVRILQATTASSTRTSACRTRVRTERRARTASTCTAASAGLDSQVPPSGAVCWLLAFRFHACFRAIASGDVRSRL